MTDTQHWRSSSPGLTRRSIPFFEAMDARVTPVFDGLRPRMTSKFFGEVAA